MEKTTTRAVYGMRGRGRPKKEPKKPRKSLSEFTRNDVWHEGERLAAEYLERRGCEVLARNWRCMFGEADIVVQDDDVVVLVEVKCRRGEPKGGRYPEQRVTQDKIARYQRLMQYFALEHPDVRSLRFDVIAINLVSDDEARLRCITNAATWDD